jgi:hypothetical protein
MFRDDTWVEVHRKVEVERIAAIRKHGELLGGMHRWMHHLKEECDESMEEMMALDYFHDPKDIWAHRTKLITELAQVAQLAETMIALLMENREREGQETWVPKQLDCQS